MCNEYRSHKISCQIVTFVHHIMPEDFQISNENHQSKNNMTATPNSVNNCMEIIFGQRLSREAYAYNIKINAIFKNGALGTSTNIGVSNKRYPMYKQWCFKPPIFKNCVNPCWRYASCYHPVVRVLHIPKNLKKTWHLSSAVKLMRFNFMLKF